MLVRLSKVASERAVLKPKSQIKQKKYATIARSVGGKHIVPDTTVLDQVLSNAGKQKSLADAYKEVLEEQNNFRTELIDEISTKLSSSPYGGVRAAASELSSVVQQISSEVTLDITGATLSPQTLDETLQVHEIGELYSQYAKAFAALPYTQTELPVPVDAIADSFAPVVRFFSKLNFSLWRVALLPKPPQPLLGILTLPLTCLTLYSIILLKITSDYQTIKHHPLAVDHSRIELPTSTLKSTQTPNFNSQS